MAAAGFLFVLAASKRLRSGERFQEKGTAIFSRLIFETAKWPARRGLSCGEESFAGVKEMRGSGEHAARLSPIGICEGTNMFLWRGIVCHARSSVNSGVRRGADADGARGSGGAAGADCDGGEAASGGPDCAAVSDGATRERVPAAVRCGGNRPVSRSTASGMVA